MFWLLGVSSGPDRSFVKAGGHAPTLDDVTGASCNLENEASSMEAFTTVALVQNLTFCR